VRRDVGHAGGGGSRLAVDFTRFGYAYIYSGNGEDIEKSVSVVEIACGWFLYEYIEFFL
jgi:hypothetical protein